MKLAGYLRPYLSLSQKKRIKDIVYGIEKNQGINNDSNEAGNKRSFYVVTIIGNLATDG